MKKWMNWSQVRKQTDSGKMHDKVAHPDPAAAPLGTDEEAGGARTSPEAITKAEQERGPAMRDQRPDIASAPPAKH